MTETAPIEEEEPTAEAPEGRALVFGDISDDPGEVIEGTQPLADYLAEHLNDYGISEGQVRVATSADEMTEMLKNGEVDLYCDSVYPATLISDTSGAKPILRRWRYGVEEYHTLIFASKESEIDSIEDLAGHMIAMDNPYSTTGYAMPSAFLIDNGMSITIKQSANDPVADDEIGIVFSYDDENTLQWVLSGLVAAGATDDVSYDLFFPEEAKEKVLILAETESVPRQVVVAGPEMDGDLLEAVTELLVNANEDENAAEALEAFQTTEFDAFPEGIDDALNQMRDLMEVVQAIPAG
ncbi:MAG: phosphate/phosphite/phosphonate ABC transporter substrate-binding protein [Anaerolineae bacterium]|nr:phosphate/phosphite/phosphonate ABC transporter substrate-binding protein [Anaerolineae bacterium]